MIDIWEHWGESIKIELSFSGFYRPHVTLTPDGGDTSFRVVIKTPDDFHHMWVSYFPFVGMCHRHQLISTPHEVGPPSVPVQCTWVCIKPTFYIPYILRHIYLGWINFKLYLLNYILTYYHNILFIDCNNKIENYFYWKLLLLKF